MVEVAAPAVSGIRVVVEVACLTNLIEINIMSCHNEWKGAVSKVHCCMAL